MTHRNDAGQDAVFRSASAAASFARRVRACLEERKQSLAELAELAELAPSLVSKLLTDTDAARREPRLEHVLAIARALEITPRELVLGTSAESILSDWIPRAELEEESKARSAAQAESARLRTELAGARSEVNSLRSSVDHLSEEAATITRRLGEVEASARRERTAILTARDSAKAKLEAALSERDQAIDQAWQNYRAWANARSYLLQLQREVAEAKGAASIGWLAALVGTVGGVIVGAAAAEPDGPKPPLSRGRARPRS